MSDDTLVDSVQTPANDSIIFHESGEPNKDFVRKLLEAAQSPGAVHRDKNAPHMLHLGWPLIVERKELPHWKTAWARERTPMKDPAPDRREEVQEFLRNAGIAATIETGQRNGSEYRWMLVDTNQADFEKHIHALALTHADIVVKGDMEKCEKYASDFVRELRWERMVPNPEVRSATVGKEYDALEGSLRIVCNKPDRADDKKMVIESLAHAVTELNSLAKQFDVEDEVTQATRAIVEKARVHIDMMKEHFPETAYLTMPRNEPDFELLSHQMHGRIVEFGHFLQVGTFTKIDDMNDRVEDLMRPAIVKSLAEQIAAIETLAIENNIASSLNACVKRDGGRMMGENKPARPLQLPRTDRTEYTSSDDSAGE